MKTKQNIIIEKGWSAFVNETEASGYQEFKNGGKAFTICEIITKPTEAELLAELESRKITIKINPKK